MSELMEHRSLIEEHWRLLVQAAEERDVPGDLLLGVLGALLADFLARQPSRVVDPWLADLPSQVERLRARRSGGVP